MSAGFNLHLPFCHGPTFGSDADTDGGGGGELYIPKRVMWALNLWATFSSSLCISLCQMHSSKTPDIRRTRSESERRRSAHGPQTPPEGRQPPPSLPHGDWAPPHSSLDGPFPSLQLNRSAARNLV